MNQNNKKDIRYFFNPKSRNDDSSKQENICHPNIVSEVKPLDGKMEIECNYSNEIKSKGKSGKKPKTFEEAGNSLLKHKLYSKWLKEEVKIGEQESKQSFLYCDWCRKLGEKII